MKALFLPVWASFLIMVTTAFADFPVTGVYVDELSWVDEAMTNFMAANDIRSGLIGIMRNGVIIYQRGFGWKDEAETIAMPENALVRLASCTKPITAAAIRKLEAAGLLSTNDYVFDLGQTPSRGILDVDPFPSLVDTSLAHITVQHCLSHTAGWDRTVEGDYAQKPCETASDMGIESPPGVKKTIDWALGRCLQFKPGDRTEYSNFGYCVLGRVIETLSGMHVVAYHRAHVLTPEMWVPQTDLLLGQSFATNELREAWYDGDGKTAENVFRNGELAPCDERNTVDKPYGSWDHEAYVGFGGIVASAATMLELAERYYLQGEDPNIGTALTNRVEGGHGGSLTGTSTLIVQRIDGVNVFIFFNKKVDGHTANDFYNDVLNAKLDAQSMQSAWPGTSLGGFWVDPDRITAGRYGSYNRPLADLDEALDYLADGSRVNFHEGTSDWTGTISTKLELRAPLGTVVIGSDQ